ncbi:CD5 antigen-like [Ambystoma mexicanum]|uniref:CD5 antigen-like n=1 Tax=Ambystoma mexicanum TaxID=8296 RepID=UPI0037E86511
MTSSKALKGDGWYQWSLKVMEDSGLWVVSVENLISVYSRGFRVTHGTGPCAGILLVHFFTRWERVCDSQWDMKDAAVACRQLGCGVPYSANFAPIPLQQLPEPVYMTDVQCRGDERCLAECPYSTKVQDYCYNRRYAGVNCTGPNDIRLVNGPSLCSGRVEVRINGMWGTVCDDSWDQKDASVVCRYLSCGFVERCTYNSTFGTSSLPVLMNNVHCMGDEAGLWNCAQGGLEHNICPTGRLAGVTCTGGADELRLVNAGNACRGRVEIKHENQWGAVCSIGWDSKAAQVVCRELGCGSPERVIIEHQGVFGEGTRRIWLSNVHCRGNKTSLSQCPHGGWGYNDCISQRREAGVICSENQIFDPSIYKAEPSSTLESGSDLDMVLQAFTEENALVARFIMDTASSMLQLSMDCNPRGVKPPITEVGTVPEPAWEFRVRSQNLQLLLKSLWLPELRHIYYWELPPDRALVESLQGGIILCEKLQVQVKTLVRTLIRRKSGMPKIPRSQEKHS